MTGSAGRSGFRRVLLNIGWLSFDRLLRLAVGLFVGVWVARYLGPERFGQLSFALAFVGLFSAFAGLGLKGIVVQDMIRDPAGELQTMGSAMVLTMLGGMSAYGGAVAVALCLRPGDPDAVILVAIVGLLLLFRVGDVGAYWFESRIMSKYVAWVSASVFLGFSLIKVALILFEAPLTAFAGAAAAEVAMIAVLTMGALHLRGPGLRALHFSVVRARGLLRESWPLLLSGVSMTIYMKMDQIMLGVMVGDREVGVYSAAARISELWYFIPMVVVASLFPLILKAREESPPHYQHRLQSLCDLMVWLAVLVAVPVSIFAGALMDLVFGAGYTESGAILAVHVWAGVFVFLGVAGGRWYVAEGLQLLNFYRKGVGAVINVALNLALIPLWGGLGAAIATVLSYAFVEFIADSWRFDTRDLFWIKMRAFHLPKTGARLVREVRRGLGDCHQVSS